MRLARMLKKTYYWLLVAIFLVMLVSTGLQVIFRYFLGYPLGWTEELSKIMFIWAAFLTVGALTMEDQLMKIEVLVERLPAGLANILNIVVKFCSGVFLLWLAVLGVRLLDLTKYQVSTALQIPYWLIYLSLLLGMIIAGGVMFAQSFAAIKTKR